MLKIKELELLEEDCNVYFDEHVIKINRYVLAHAFKEVQRWQCYGGSNFNIKLIELIAKADENNKNKLMLAYPEFVVAYLIWYWKTGFEQISEEEEFFKKVIERLENEKEI